MSNYDDVIETWRQKFLHEMDQERIIKKFGLCADDSYIYITYFNHEYRIHRKNGEIKRKDEPEQEIGFNTQMVIYNTFYYSVEAPMASGELVPFRQVKRVYPFEKAYRETVLHTLQTVFSGHVEELKRAGEALGGIRLAQGDAGYVLPAFPFLNIAVLFWDGDEEFEAQANMLFDSEITQFMHEEDVVCVAADAVKYLTEAAGLEVKRVFG